MLKLNKHIFIKIIKHVLNVRAFFIPKKQGGEAILNVSSITLGQLAIGLSIIIPILTALWFLFKIYTKILQNEKLTRASLGAITVMLDHFIENKIGNGEFKKAREEINNVLLGKEVS